MNLTPLVERAATKEQVMKTLNGSWMSHVQTILTLFFVALVISTAVNAQEPAPPRVGGHVGIAFPIVTRSDGRTTTISEDFIVGFPIGVTIRNSSPFAFDFEFVPTVNNSPRQDVTLTVHPGVIYGFKKNYAVGLRAAFDIGSDTYGFTPLVQRSWKIKGNTKYFVEADFPVRFRQQPDGRRTTAGGFTAHFGVSF